MFQEVDIMSVGSQSVDNAEQNPWFSLIEHKYLVHLGFCLFLSHRFGTVCFQTDLELFLTEAPASLS